MKPFQKMFDSTGIHADIRATGSADRRPFGRRPGAAAWAIAALGSLAFAACGGDEAHTEARVLEPVSVTVTPAWSATAARSYTARIEATQSAHVATRMSGTLTAMAVDVGSEVQAGDLLARLDDADVRARISGAEAQHALAEQTHGRIARLAADGAASQQELDEAAARLAAARAGLAEARAQAAYVEVRAPFSGVVTARMADPGALALPGQPILTLEGSGVRQAVADLPANAVDGVSEGQAVVLSHATTEVAGVVRRVVPSLDPMSRRFRIEVELGAAAPWPAGEVVTLRIEEAGSGSLWIPADAVIERGQLRGVYTVENDSLRLRWLRLGRTLGDRVEVLSGPGRGLQVVRRPAADLEDGAPVSGVTVQGVEREEDR